MTDIKKEVKDLHKLLINERIPHIITILEGEMATVIMAGTVQHRKDLLEAILADKDWEEKE